MASDLGVIVKLRADASQYTAEFGQAKQLAQSLASTLQASGSQAAAGLATATTAAQGLATATATGAQQASSGLAQAGAAAQAVGAGFKATGAQAGQAAAELEGLSKSSRETAQSQQQSRTAGESFIAMLRDQVAVAGKSTEELLRYRAAQAGVATEAAPLIVQLQQQKTAQLAAAEAAQQEAAAQRAAAAEKQQQASDQARLLAGLREQIATSSMSAEELLRYRAAMAGVGAEAEPLIRQWQNQRTAQTAAAQAAREEEAAQRSAAAAQQQRTNEQARFLDGLREQIALQGKSSTEVLQYRAAQLGVSAEAANSIRLIDDANKKGAISAGQHAQAMRMLPAQMTDVVTSVASGMPIWMVAIQQGGQIKDSFGGAGNAVKALASAVTPAVAVIGTLAVAAGTVAAAYYQGSSEGSTFRRELLMSGNAAGTSVSQLTDLARAVGELTTTQGAATQVLAQMAGTGAVAADNLQGFAETAINLERYIGQPVKTTVGHLEELGKKPLEASVKLNEQYRYLTDSVYLQIKALQDQGKHDEAASLAQKTYSQAMGERADEMRSQMGSLERVWDSLGRTAARAWDAMLNVGRAASLSDIRTKIDATNTELNKLLVGDDFGTTGGGAATGDGGRGRAAAVARLRKELGELEAAAAPLEAQEFEARTKAEKQAADQAAVEARTRVEAQRKAMRTRAEIRQDEIKQLDRDRETLKLSTDEYSKLLANIEQKYKDPKGAKGSTAGQVSITDTQIAGLKSQLQAAQQYHQQLLTLGASASELNAGERESLKLAEQIKLATNAKTKAKLEQAKVEADALGVQLRTNDGLDKSYKSHQQSIDANYKDAQAITQRAREQAAANEVFGKGRTAIEQMTLATLQHQLTEAEQRDNYDPAYVASLREKIAAQKEWVIALGQADYKAVIAHADELLRNANELARAYDDELALSGLTGLEREKIVAQRAVELKYAKEIAAIDNGSLTDAEKRQAKEKVYAAQRVESAAAVGKATQNHMAKASEEINRTLTDALMRGFENGKGFAENFADTVKNMFSTMVLRPVISAVMAPVSGVINGVVQSGLNAVGLGGGNSLLSTASNVSSLHSLTTGNSLVGQAANWLGIGSSAAAAGTGLGLTAASAGAGAIGAGIGSSIGLGAAGTAAGTGLGLTAGASGLGLTAGSAGASVIGGSLGTSAAVTSGAVGAGAGAGGLTGALAAVPGWGWALAGGAMLLSQLDLGSRGANHVGAAYSTSGLGNAKSAEALFGRAAGDWYDDLTQRHSADLEKQLGTSVEALSSVYKSLSGYAGDSAKQIDIVAGFASNPAYGDEDSYGYFKLINKLTGETLQEYTQRDGGLGTDPAAAYTKFGTDLANGLFAQLRASGGLEKWVDEKLAKLGDAPSLEQLSQAVEEINAAQAALTQFGLAMPEFAAQSSAARAALMDQAGGSAALVERLGSFYSNYFTESERAAVATRQVTEQLQALGYAMPASRDEYRAWVTTAISTGSAGAASAAGLLKLESAVAQLLPASKDAAAGIAEAAKALRSAADIASKEQDLQIQLLRAQGQELAAVSLERQRELSALEEYGTKAVAIQQQIWALQDHAFERSERSLRLQRQQEARTAADEIVSAQREAFRGLGKSLADEALRAGGGLIGSLAVSAQEAESAGQFKEVLDGATASLAELEKLGLADELAGYTAEIGKLVQATKQALADQVANSRLLSGNAQGAIAALMSASTINYSQFTSGGSFSAGAFNSALAKERAGMAGGLIADASVNALQVQNVGAVIGQLMGVVSEAREYVARETAEGIADAVGASVQSSVVRALSGVADVITARAMAGFTPSAPGLANISKAQSAYATAARTEYIDGTMYMGTEAIAYARSVRDLNAGMRSGTVTADEYASAMRLLEDRLGTADEVIGVLSSQMSKAGGAALDLASAGFEGLDHYFGSITASAAALDAQARQSGSSLGQIADGIGRMQSAATAFGSSADAVLSGLQGAVGHYASAAEQAIVDARGVVAGSVEWYGLYDASARYAAQSAQAQHELAGQMNTEGSQLRKGTLAADAARLAAEVMTTASAAEFAKQISQSGAFSAADATGIRDASLLLDGVKANDAAAFEAGYARLTAALNRGTLNEAQYIELMNLGLRTLSGEQAELDKRSGDLANAFTRLRDAAKSTADALLLSETDSTLTGEQRLSEAQRQYAEILGKARAGDADAVSGLDSASKALLDAARGISTEGEYRSLFAETIRDLRVLEVATAPTVKAGDVAAGGTTPVLKVPAFDVGTNYLPSDMLALVHAGERIIPAADNRQLMQALQGGGGSPEVVALLSQILKRLESLESSNLDGHQAVQLATIKGTEALQQIVAEGIRPYAESKA